MTYCLALRLDEGLVFLADTRTTAGVDNVGTYRKLHVVQPEPDRVFVLESAGNLATTQQVLDRIRGDLATAGDHESLATVDHLFEAALYVGRLSREVAGSTGTRWRSRGQTVPPLSSSAARSPARPPTSCSSTRRGTTSGPRMSCRSCRSARASTASSCSSWPCGRGGPRHSSQDRHRFDAAPPHRPTCRSALPTTWGSTETTPTSSSRSSTPTPR